MLLLLACAGPPASPDETAAPACAAVSGTASVLLVDATAPHAVVSPAGADPDYADGIGLVALADGGLLHVEGEDVLRSDDGGCSWSVVGTLPDPAALFAVGDVVYAYGGAHHARSDDGGATWTALGAAPTGMGEGLDVDPDDPLRVGVIGPDGVYRSEDGGVTWAKTAALPEASPPRGGAVVGDTVVAVGDGLSTSTDGGATWIDRTAAALAAVEDPGDGFLDRVAVHPDDPQRLAATFVSASARAVLRSDDGGATWTASGEHGPGFESGWITFAPGGGDAVLVGSGDEDATLLVVGPDATETVELGPAWTFGQVVGAGGRWVLTR